MFPVIFLNTLTRLGVLPHFLENLSLSPSRLNLDKDGGKTGMFEKMSHLIEVLQREQKMKLCFLP